MNEKNNLVSALGMRSIELNAEYLGVSQLQLMENAGSAVADVITSRFSSDSRVVVYSGPGKNGGDGMVVARILSSQGYDVTLTLVGRESDLRDEIVVTNWAALRNMTHSVDVEILPDSSQIKPVDCDVIVDALLGIGARGAPRPPIAHAINVINQSDGFKVAVDIPTGVDSDTGEIHGNAVQADLTVTFHRAKKGLLKAKKYVGELVVATVGIPIEAELFVGPGDVEKVRRERPPESHKGDFGRILVIGGSEMYTGAPAYVAFAALRTGADLVYVVAPKRAADTIAAFSPNVITISLKGTHLGEQHLETIESLIRRSTAVAIGPGLGVDEETFRAVDRLLGLLGGLRIPTLLDADALKAFGQSKQKLKMPCVMTPHLGEFEAISGARPPSVLDSKMEAVRELAKELDSTILLKGNIDVISDGRHVRLNRTGNPGMTVGGTGDVLSGIAVAFLGQRFDAFDAACAAAFVNGASGDFAFRTKGFHLVASDLIEHIPTVVSNPMLHREIQAFGSRSAEVS